MNTGATPTPSPFTNLHAEPKHEERRADTEFGLTLSLATIQAQQPTPMTVAAREASSGINAKLPASKPRTELEQRATVDVSKLAAAELRGEGSPAAPAPDSSTQGSQPSGRTRERTSTHTPSRAANASKPEIAIEKKADAGLGATPATSTDSTRAAQGVRAQANAPVASASVAKLATPAARMIEGLAATGASTASRAGPGGSSVTLRGVGTPPDAKQVGARVSAKKAQPPLPQRTDRQIHAQAVRGIAAAVKQGGGSITLRVEPEHLGALRVRVEVKGHKVSALVEAGTEPARRLLEEGRESLRAALEARGLNVERVEVRLNERLSDGVTDDADSKGKDGGGGEDAAGSWSSRDGEDRRGDPTRRDHQEGRRDASQSAAEPRPTPHHAAWHRAEGGLVGLNAVA
ncbi:MAG: flagellar hook-length control protein FliK [Phycisphaerales bacterium]|nr:flagellar hook-length control protein FliK [Phycisphaerales bacterium]